MSIPERAESRAKKRPLVASAGIGEFAKEIGRIAGEENNGKSGTILAWRNEKLSELAEKQ